jgi:hypothetical protein
MRRLPHGRIIHVQVIADGAHHNLTGVQAYTNLDLHAMGAAHCVSIAAYAGLHGQGGVAGPHGVVFMSQRCPEQSHNAVPKDLVHGALIVVHRLHHDM